MYPTFIMMVGLPYSGKSYYAEKLSHEFGASVHSSDAIRAELLGDAQDQSNPEKVFTELHRHIREDLSAGRSTIYDATNINYKRRMSFLQQLKKIPCRKVCVLMATPFGTILERSRSRERVVPYEVVENMYRHIWIPYYYEGWDEIRLVYPNGFNHWDQRLLFSHDGGICNISQDNPHHTMTVGDHCLMAFALVESSSNEVMEAALLHDIGKPFTKTFTNRKGEKTDVAHYYDHHLVSAYDSLFYTSPSLDRLRVAMLIQWHMKHYEVAHAPDPATALEKFRALVGDEIYKDVEAIHDADRKAH